ncbi:MAG: very short patch repair endonuclease [Lentisphaeria bacterium]
MTDTVSKEVRSRIMSRIRSKDTKPEKAVRSLLHRLGFRFRLHCRKLPGTPDIVLKRHRTCVFVQGCFWHRHPGCPVASTPASNREFWQAKFARNVARDQRNQAALRALGWNLVVVWECELRNPPALAARLRAIRGETTTYYGNDLASEAPPALLAADAPAEEASNPNSGLPHSNSKTGNRESEIRFNRPVPKAKPRRRERRR